MAPPVWQPVNCNNILNGASCMAACVSCKDTVDVYYYCYYYYYSNLATSVFKVDAPWEAIRGS